MTLLAATFHTDNNQVVWL